MARFLASEDGLCHLYWMTMASVEYDAQQIFRGGVDKGMRPKRGFTLIELLVVIAIIGILAAMLLLSLAKGKEQSKGMKCLSNVKQLTVAWMLYAGDYNDLLVTNTCWENTNSWAAGFLDWSDPTDSDNTNTATLMSPQGLLWPYSKSLGIYVCPSDPSGMIRSISMNMRMNGTDFFTAPIGEFANPNRMSAINKPGPAMAFVFVDERADSINDGFFVVDMVDTNASATVANVPANYHNGCSAITFADGHGEIHKWTDPRTEPPMIPNTLSGGYFAPNDPDVAWIQQHCSAPE